jgi:ubiquinone/menaquinone biosynthesis C-methylase UbiE
MSLKDKIISQGVEPRGALGWVTAKIMLLLSDSHGGNLEEILHLGPEDEVLDVACGAGSFLKKRAAVAKFIAGMDHSDVQLRMALKKNRERVAAGTAEIVKGDSTALPWPDGRFSAVTCNCVGCFAQPRESIKEMCRVLRPGGRIGLTFDYYPDKEKARKAEQWWGLPTWIEPEVREMVEAAGFSKVTISHEKNILFVGGVKP